MTRQLLGTGIFTWDGSERRSSRYGCFALHNKNYENTNRSNVTVNHTLFDSLVGKKVRLQAHILQARPSGHAGDLRLGIKPSTPSVNEVITIGVGWLHKSDILWSTGFELWPASLPSECRETLWIDPRTLYRLHDQTVNIYVELSEEPPTKVEPIEAVPEHLVFGKDQEGSFYQVSDQVESIEHITNILGEGLFSLEPFPVLKKHSKK